MTDEAREREEREREEREARDREERDRRERDDESRREEERRRNAESDADENEDENEKAQPDSDKKDDAKNESKLKIDETDYNRKNKVKGNAKRAEKTAGRPKSDTTAARQSNVVHAAFIGGSIIAAQNSLRTMKLKKYKKIGEEISDELTRQRQFRAPGGGRSVAEIMLELKQRELKAKSEALQERKKLFDDFAKAIGSTADMLSRVSGRTGTGRAIAEGVRGSTTGMSANVLPTMSNKRNLPYEADDTSKTEEPALER